MRDIKQSNRFKREYKLMKKRGKDLQKINAVILMLANDEDLPPALCDHQLSGNFVGFRDCHVEPDWVFCLKSRLEMIVELFLENHAKNYALEFAF